MLDINATKRVRIAERDWDLSIVPFGIAHQLQQRRDRVLRALGQHQGNAGAPAASEDERGAAETLALSITVDWLRWGLRSYAGNQLAGEAVEFDGRKYTIIAKGVLDPLLHLRNGTIALEVAKSISETNWLTEDDVLGFL